MNMKVKRRNSSTTLDFIQGCGFGGGGAWSCSQANDVTQPQDATEC